MSIERRRAYIEFTSFDTCQITTLFRQKSFDLNDGDIIDLINLKKVEQGNSFSAHVSRSGGDCYINVYAMISPFEPVKFWGWAGVDRENKKKFEGNIYVND